MKYVVETLILKFFFSVRSCFGKNDNFSPLVFIHLYISIGFIGEFF